MLNLIIALSTMFVYYDTTNNNIGKIEGEKSFYNLSPIMWSVVVCFLWIIAFPLYLYKRSELIEKAKNNPKKVHPKTRRNVLVVQGVFTGLLVISILFGGSVNSVDFVKGGTLKINEGVTVEEAFDNYDYFKEVTWVVENKNGKEVVQVQGLIDFTKHPQGANYLINEIAKAEIIFQFSINDDGKSFDYDGCMLYATTDHGEEKGGSLSQLEAMAYLEALYKNIAL